MKPTSTDIYTEMCTVGSLVCNFPAECNTDQIGMKAARKCRLPDLIPATCNNHQKYHFPLVVLGLFASFVLYQPQFLRCIVFTVHGILSRIPIFPIQADWMTRRLHFRGSRIIGSWKCSALWNILNLSGIALFRRTKIQFESVEQYLHDPAVMTEAELVTQITETLHHYGMLVRLFRQSRPKSHEHIRPADSPSP